MPIGQAGLFRPGVELLLDLREVAFRCRRLGHIEAGVAQTGDHVLRGHEGVVAEEPQQHLAGRAAEPPATLGQDFEQPDLVGGRPIGEELAERAMLLRHIQDEARVLAHRGDLRAVADDAGVHRQLVPELVGLEREPRGLEAEKSLLESGPFRFDHAPGEPGREHPPGHFGEHAVVAELHQRLRVGLGRHEAGERFGAALALFGPGADGSETKSKPGLRYESRTIVGRGSRLQSTGAQSAAD